MLSLSSIPIASFALVSSLFLSFAQARIYNVSVPSTALVGSTINATLYIQEYIQNWEDFGAVWGLVRPDQTIENGVGIELGYQNIYGDPNVPIRGNISYPVTLPNVTSGEYTFVAAIPHLVGASGSTSVGFFNQSITLVDTVKRKRQN